MTFSESQNMIIKSMIEPHKMYMNIEDSSNVNLKYIGGIKGAVNRLF